MLQIDPLSIAGAFEINSASKMTLRDWFAGMVVAQLVWVQSLGSLHETAPDTAKQAYIVADAMITERNKTNATD
jgi:hypothetical protein